MSVLISGQFRLFLRPFLHDKIFVRRDILPRRKNLTRINEWKITKNQRSLLAMGAIFGLKNFQL